MLVAIAGAHGQIARLLTRRLVARGDTVRGLIRNPDHAEDLREDGAEPVVCDLETADASEVEAAVDGADAAVFAAGAGPGSGAERKWTVDRDGALKLLEAARACRVERYVIVSSVGAEDPPAGDEVFAVYLRAKAEADQAVMASDRTWTVVRPGRLTDDAPTGRARLDEEPFRGDIGRADVAHVLDVVLHDDRAAARVLYANGGDTVIDEAL
jgi:nucleoside-diphosphate-sugar epimerase